MKERTLRMSEDIKRSLSSFFQRGSFSLSYLSSMSLTVTQVSMSKDFGWADVYVTIWYGQKVLSDAEKKEVETALNGAKGVARKYIAQNLNMKKTPDLRFWYDQTFDYAAKIDDLLGPEEAQ